MPKAQEDIDLLISGVDDTYQKIRAVVSNAIKSTHQLEVRLSDVTRDRAALLSILLQHLPEVSILLMALSYFSL